MRRAGQRRRSARYGHLLGKQLLDALGDIGQAAGSRRRCEKLPPPTAPTDMDLDGLSRELGDRDAASLGLMAKARVEIIGELDRRSLHVCQHTANPAGWTP